MSSPVTESPPNSAVPDFVPFVSSDMPTGPNGGSAAGELTCKTCGKQFSHTGRGRKPGRCADCRRQTTGSSRASRNRPSVAILGQSVTMNLQTLGAVVAMVNAYDGQVIMSGAPVFGQACANVAEHDPRFRRFLERSSSMVVYGELIAAALIIATPILANHGMLPARAAENIGSAYQQMAGMYPTGTGEPTV